MCGSVRLTSGERVRVGGDLVAKVETGDRRRGPWNGFARDDKLAWWLQKNAVPATIEGVTGYYEKGLWFPLPAGTAVLCLVLTQDVKTGGEVARAGELRVVTRPARTPEEARVHHRFPCTVAA